MTYTRGMCKLTLLLLLALVALVPLRAQPPADPTTDLVNCRWSNAEDTNAKGGFIVGYAEAVGMYGTSKQYDDLTSDASVGEVMRGVDKLCADPANAIIPASVMLGYFSARFKGATEEYINTQLANSRRKWSIWSAPPPTPKTGGKKQ